MADDGTSQASPEMIASCFGGQRSQMTVTTDNIYKTVKKGEFKII